MSKYGEQTHCENLDSVCQAGYLLSRPRLWVNARDLCTYRICSNALINAHADISSITRGQKFGLTLNLHLCFVHAISEG